MEEAEDSMWEMLVARRPRREPPGQLLRPALLPGQAGACAGHASALPHERATWWPGALCLLVIQSLFHTPALCWSWPATFLSPGGEACPPRRGRWEPAQAGSSAQAPLLTPVRPMKGVGATRLTLLFLS